jgi:hypothetical protein
MTNAKTLNEIPASAPFIGSAPPAAQICADDGHYDGLSS